MRANVGDRIVVRGHQVGEPVRSCEVLEAHGADGGAPYLVKWDKDGHEGIYFPGGDASVEHEPGAAHN